MHQPTWTLPASRLWAITSYFNPIGYTRRRANYAEFRRRLTVPLITVELAYDGRFDLPDDAAEILIRVPGKDVIWQDACRTSRFGPCRRTATASPGSTAISSSRTRTGARGRARRSSGSN